MRKRWGRTRKMGGVKVGKNGEGVVFFLLLFFPRLSLLFRFGCSPFDLVVPPPNWAGFAEIVAALALSKARRRGAGANKW